MISVDSFLFLEKKTLDFIETAGNILSANNIGLWME